ncbi:MAG: hypothetical protein ACKVWV_15260 [Planctomycetota bacterium]
MACAAGSKASAAILIALILGYVAVRLAAVLALSDVFYYGEEMARGTAAKAMLDRLPVEHYKLGHWYYEGGAFTTSHVTALFFLLLGPCLLAHKLVAIGFGAAVLAAGFCFARRWFGLAAATLFGLLFTFAPESFQKLSLLNIGTHFAATLFLVLILHNAFRIAFDGELSLRRLGVTGAVCGFATYFSYQTLPAIAFAALLVIVMRLRELRLWHFAWASASMAVGLTPFWIMWSLAGREVFNIHGTYLFASSHEQFDPNGVVELLRSVLAERGTLEQVVIVWAWLAPLAGAVVLWRAGIGAERKSALVLVAYLAFFAVVYAASGFQVTRFYHYFMVNRFSSFWVIGTVLAAAGMARGWRASSSLVRLASALSLAVLILSGAIDSVRTIADGRLGAWRANARTLLATKGYSYLDYLPYFRSHLAHDPSMQLRVALSFRESTPQWLAIESAQSLLDDASMTPSELERMLADVETEHALDLRAGLGPYLLARAGGRLDVAIDTALAESSSARAWQLGALGRWGPGHYRVLSCLQVPPGFLRETERMLPKLERSEDREAYFRGMGHRLHRLFQLQPEVAARSIEGFPVDVREFLADGYAEARGWNRLR